MSFLLTCKSKTCGKPVMSFSTGHKSTLRCQKNSQVDPQRFMSTRMLKSRINYTSYDLQRLSDIVRPALKIETQSTKRHSKRSFIVLSVEDDVDPNGQRHYSLVYAQVLAIFHVMVRHRKRPQPDYQRKDILWVRWLMEEPRRSGHQLRSLRPTHDFSSGSSLGFIDPADVIRACHIIPNFNKGRTSAKSTGASPLFCDEQGDWERLYVDEYV